MNRRNFISKSGLATVGLATGWATGMFRVASLGEAWASSEKKPAKKGESTQDAKTVSVLAQPEIAKKLAKVRSSTFECLDKAHACLAHCRTELAKGSQEFVHCQSTVEQMIPICDATAKLAAMSSPHVVQMLDVCISSMKACRDSCMEHEAHFAHGMHRECKECAESCERCITECTELKSQLLKAGVTSGGNRSKC
jgi:Cys-rich four helix bundle protein (predicted Tat secretion target)